MSSESERGRRAVDKLTQRILEHGRESGKPVSAEQARRQAAEVARKTDNEKGW